MQIKNRLKRWFKLRFAILYPIGILLMIFAFPDDGSIRTGIYFIIPGLLLRLWANGYAIKLEKLTTSGPYAFVRHPLYLGTLLITLGFVVMLRLSYWGALFLLLMLVVYYRTYKNEERMLIEKFHDAYRAYQKKVPALFPTVVPYRQGEKWPFSIARLFQSQEYKLFIWIIVIAIIFHLKEEFIVEHEPIGTKNVLLIILIFFLGSLDIAGEIYRKKRKKKLN